MEKQQAKFIAHVALKAGSEVSKLLPTINKMDHEQAKDIANAVLKVSRIIGEDIVNKIFEMHPEIKDEFESMINNFGRLP